MSHPHQTDQQRDELRTTAKELSGCGATAAEIVRAMRISQAEVLAYLRQHKQLPQQNEFDWEPQRAPVSER
jgi:ABC-type transporter Mla subunit MlaD